MEGGDGAGVDEHVPQLTFVVAAGGDHAQLLVGLDPDLVVGAVEQFEQLGLRNGRQMVGVHRPGAQLLHGEPQRLPQAGHVVPGQADDQLGPPGDAPGRQVRDVLHDLPEVVAAHVLGHAGVGRLKPHQQLFDVGVDEDVDELVVEELRAHVGVDGDVRGEVPEHAQDLLAPGGLAAEDRVDQEDAADPPGAHVEDLGAHEVGVEGGEERQGVVTAEAAVVDAAPRGLVPGEVGLHRITCQEFLELRAEQLDAVGQAPVAPVGHRVAVGVPALPAGRVQRLGQPVLQVEAVEARVLGPLFAEPGERFLALAHGEDRPLGPVGVGHGPGLRPAADHQRRLRGVRQLHGQLPGPLQGPDVGRDAHHVEPLGQQRGPGRLCRPALLVERPQPDLPLGVPAAQVGAESHGAERVGDGELGEALRVEETDERDSHGGSSKDRGVHSEWRTAISRKCRRAVGSSGGSGSFFSGCRAR